MNVLFVHEVDYLKKPVFDVHWLAESLSLLGHKVYVLYYESMWRQNGSDKRLWMRVSRMSREMLCARAFKGARVHLICPSIVRMPVVSRMSAFISHYFEIKRAIEEKKIDAIVLYSVPTNGLQAVHWAKHFGIPVVFRSIDVLNQLVPYPVLRPLTKWMERKVYSSVDRILTITPKLSEYVIGLGADPNRVDILPIPVDTSLFYPCDDTIGLKRNWGLDDDDKVVLFMGTLFDFCGLDGFIQQLPRIMRDIPNMKLMIVGDGKQRLYLENIIAFLHLQREVIITGFQPYKDLPRYINMADVCVNPFVVNKTTRDIFPGKTAQILACGKPLVMRPLDGVKALISGEGQGVVYAADDSGMAMEVLALLKSDEGRSRIGQNGLRYVQEHHDCRNVAKQLEDVLTELVKNK